MGYQHLPVPVSTYHEIISHIDYLFRQDMQARGMQYDRINYLAPLGDGKIRMAWLACYGSFSINGVAALHTQILKTETLRDFYEIWPEKFSNKTKRGHAPPLAEDLQSRTGWIADGAFRNRILGHSSRDPQEFGDIHS